MASFKGNKATFPAPNRVDGTSVDVVDKIALTAVPAATDTIDFLLPAGVQLVGLTTINDDMDTGTTLLYSVGYRPVDGSNPAAVTDYFAAAGQTAFRAAGRVEYTFKPIVFEYAVYVSFLIGTAASGHSGTPELHIIASVNQIGTK